MVELMAFYYANLLDRLGRAPADRAALVSMERLKADLAPALAALYRQLGIALNSEFEDLLSREAGRARSYTSRHHYRLSDFGLDPETVRRRFADVYDRFVFGPENAPQQSGGEGVRGTMAMERAS
jgi:hypothetical protein